MCFTWKMICLLLFLVLLTLFILYLLQEERIYNEIQNIPGPPLVPHFKSENEIDSYLKDALNNVRKLRKEYGSVVRLCVGSQVIVLLTEPKYIEQLLSSEISCKEDFYKSFLTAGKINKWFKSRIGTFLMKLSSPVDSLFLYYFEQGLSSSKGTPYTEVQTNEIEFTSWLFKTDKILKTQPWQQLAEKISKDEQSNSIIKFVVTSALRILANDPGVQQETFEEIAQIFGTKEGAKIEFQSARKIVHMERVLKEIICPRIPVPFIVKTLTKAIKFGNISVPAGVKILIFTSGDGPTYPQPFDLNGNVEKQSHSNPPLISKPRSCVGQKYIIMRAKVVLIKLVRNFEVLPTQEENGLSFKLKPRDRNVVEILNFNKL